MTVKKTEMAEELSARLTRPAFYYFDVCTRCGACTERCHMYIETKDPVHSPAYKLALLHRVYRRYHTLGGKVTPKLFKAMDLSNESLKEISRAMFECTRCRRCTIHCPFGIDHTLPVSAGRSLLRAGGQAPKELTIMAKVASARSKNIANYEYLYTLLVKTLENQLREETRNKDAEIPTGNYDADILYVPIAGQYHIDSEKCMGCELCSKLCPQKAIKGELKKPHSIAQEECIGCGICYKNCKFEAVVAKSPSMLATIMPAAEVFNAARESWSLSLYNAANYSYLMGDIDAAKKETSHLIKEAEELGIKTLVITECGHGFHIMKRLAPKWFNRSFPFEVKSITEIMAKYVEERTIKLDPSRNSKAVTYHDPCELGRNSGIFDEPRIVLNAVVEKFVELAPPNREYNWCCGGGGGLVAIPEYKELRMKTGKRKIEQLKETKAKIVATTCENCRSQLNELNEYYNLGIQVTSLMDLMANTIKKK